MTVPPSPKLAWPRRTYDRVCLAWGTFLIVLKAALAATGVLEPFASSFKALWWALIGALIGGPIIAAGGRKAQGSGPPDERETPREAKTNGTDT